MSFSIGTSEIEVLTKLDGASLCSLKKDGVEYLWQGDEEHWAGQAPVCFPIVGVLPDGEAYAFGKKCTMKRHGIARISPFEVIEKSGERVAFCQRSSEETRKAFPFDYELVIAYSVEGSTVICEYTVLNTGKEKLPFVIGGHPAFNCPLSEGESFENYKVVFDKKMTKAVLRPDHITGLVDPEKRYPALDNSDTIELVHELFEENDAMVFDGVESKCATLIGPSGKGVKLEYGDFDNLLIWSACNSADFVALEPWCGISHCLDEDKTFENKRGMTILEPGESKTFKYMITLI